MNSVRQELGSVGQEHLLKFVEELSDDERASLKADISSVDWKQLDAIFKNQVSAQLDGKKLKPAEKIDDKLLQELPDEYICGTTRCSKKDLEEYHMNGLSLVRQGKVAALLLAGGQGTRLGVDYPKGMFDVGLPSHKTLFHLQAERIIELSKQAATDSESNEQPIIWYIMTSEATMARTKQYFRDNGHFGISQDRVVFFDQGTIPCFGLDGKVLLAERHKISRSPDGNGGLYEALHARGVLDHMKAHGVEFVHVYCVDNILVRVCDPAFIGFCVARNADTGAKVIEKILPNESVGTICKVGSQFKVIEYSEIPDCIATKRNPATGKLCYNAANICEHFFKVSFLDSIKGDKKLPYHLAIKRVPHVQLDTGELIKPDEPNGIKLEKFIFDVFEFTQNFVAWEVKREDEFSPLKNADGSPKDNPTTAREALLRAHKLGILTC